MQGLAFFHKETLGQYQLHWASKVYEIRDAQKIF